MFAEPSDHPICCHAAAVKLLTQQRNKGPNSTATSAWDPGLPSSPPAGQLIPSCFSRRSSQCRGPIPRAAPELRRTPSLHACTCHRLLPRRCQGRPTCTRGEPTTSSPGSRAKTKAHLPWQKKSSPLLFPWGCNPALLGLANGHGHGAADASNPPFSLLG